MRFLLVDDQPFILALLSGQLTSLGFPDSVGFSCPEQALDYLRSSRVDVAVCDLNMPGMDGVLFVRRLAEAGYDGSVVLMTAEDSRVLEAVEQIARAQGLHVLGALHKPVGVEALRRLLEQAPARARERRLDRRMDPGELREAIEGGQLVNHYQPKVDLESGRVTTVEALVRWRHPRHGLVYPDEFIGVAEDHGLIEALTLRVLRTALAQARAWSAAGLDLRFAVNVSMDNLTSTEFADQVAGALGAAGVPPEQLVLEVTESRLMKNRLAALEILTRLRLKRVGLSVDDFGTGHSSLSQLRDLPFTGLKVDRSFVHGAALDASRRAIVEASLSMAKKLGMETIGEGVEDIDDWEMLRASGCDLAQGYFISPPMDGPELPGWINRWAERRAELFA